MDVRKWVEQQAQKMRHKECFCPQCFDDAFASTITVLVQALRFYADPAMWDCDLIEAMQESGSDEGSTEVPIFTDHGAMAKAALAELEKP